MNVSPEVIRLILAHESIAYLRPAFRQNLERGLDGGFAFGLQLEYSAWERGGAITLSLEDARYGEPGHRVTVSWPGCGAHSAGESAGFFHVGMQVANLAAQLDRYLTAASK